MSNPSNELNIAMFDLGELLCISHTGDIYHSSDQEFIDCYGDSKDHVLVKEVPSYFKTEKSIAILKRYIEKQNIIDHVGRIDLINLSPHSKLLIYDIPPGDMLTSWLERSELYLDEEQLAKLCKQIQENLERLSLVEIRHGMIELNSIYLTTEGSVYLLDSAIVAAKQELIDKEYLDHQLVPNAEALTASPEVCFGRDKKSTDDVFNLSSLIYQLITGKSPYEEKNSVQALLRKTSVESIKTITVSQWEALQKGLSLQAENRYKLVDELLENFFNIEILNDSNPKLALISSHVTHTNKPKLSKVRTQLMKHVVMNLWLLIPMSLGSISGILLMSLFLSK